VAEQKPQPAAEQKPQDETPWAKVVVIPMAVPVFNPDENLAPAAAGQRGKVKTASRSAGAYADYWQGADIDRARLAEAPPLQDTAEELKAVALKLGAPDRNIHLGKVWIPKKRQ
jgi:hypothetical protein